MFLRRKGWLERETGGWMRVGYYQKGKEEERMKEGRKEVGKTTLSSNVCWSLTGSSSQAVAESMFLIHSSLRAVNIKEISVCKSIMVPNGTNGNTLGAQRGSGHVQTKTDPVKCG